MPCAFCHSFRMRVERGAKWESVTNSLFCKKLQEKWNWTKTVLQTHPSLGAPSLHLTTPKLFLFSLCFFLNNEKETWLAPPKREKNAPVATTNTTLLIRTQSSVKIPQWCHPQHLVMKLEALPGYFQLDLILCSGNGQPACTSKALPYEVVFSLRKKWKVT